MQVRTAFPLDAVTGGDFVTRRYEVGEGDRVVDLDIDLDGLPAWGRLCLHEQTVQLMMTALGWEHDPHLAAKVKEQRDDIAKLRKQNRALADAVHAMLTAASALGVDLATVKLPDEVPA